ncbi:MAG: pyruvate dehydrogenase E1 component, partial [Candidatus Omnitrophota bacterium]
PESARSQFDTLGLHSYPGMIDPLDIDIPTGSVGIGPAATIALAIVQKWLKAQDFEVADSHFYATVGDGEFGEGNYLEALSMAAEFEVNNITHIVDFNRLSLDGVMHERTFERIKQTYEANGWRVISLKWGRLMQAAFERHDGGELYMNVIGDLKQQEYELLTAQKPSYIRKYLIDRGAQGLEEFLSIYDDEELYALVTDLGGHDFYNLVRAMNEAKADQTKPVAIIAYTHKGWGIDPLIGNPASHGLLLTDDQIEDLRISLQIDSEDDFPIFDKASTESQILESIKQRVSEQRDARKETKRTNSEASFPKELIDNLPDRLMPKASIIKDVPTQVHMGTIIGMMRRIADTPEEELETDTERALRPIAERYLTVSPDVATSTQLGPGLDQNIFGPEQDRNWFETVELGRALDDKKMKSTPDTTRILKGARHFEVGIAEMNALTMAIALGKSKDFVGTALFPLVTVYDMFLFRRALDIAFYGQYWLSNFLMIGTPSGSSLAPEGAQHQSGIAPVIGRSLVNTITWEPAFPQELEYIEADRLKRVVTENTKGRNAVYYRLSTVPVKKAELINQLQDQAKYQDLDEASIMDLWGQDVLKGGYRLVDYSNQADYDPDFNVVNLVTTGAMMNEALLASDALRESKNRTYANVIIVSSPNLILGALGEKTGFEQLKALIPASERAFTPVVTVADAPTAYLSGIADVLGLGLGVEALGLIKNGTSARDIERIYMHHGISRVHIAVTAQKQLMFRDDGDGRVQHFIESDWGSDPDAPRMARDYDFSIHQDMLVSLMSLAGVEGGFPEWGKQTRLTPEQFMRGKRVLNIGVETFDGLRGGGKINPRNLVSHYKELGIDITGLTRAISENDDDAQLVLGDARAMPFEDNSFDMAISINFYDDIYIQLMLMLQNEIVEVKHYSEFYTRIAQEVRRVLVEGGQYLVSNVDGEMFKNVMIPIFESHGFEVIRPLAELVSGEGTYLFVNHKETINESALTELDNIPDSRMTDIESLEQINPQFSNESLGYSMTIVDKKRISRIFALGNYSDENQATQDLNVVGVFAATLVALPTLLGLNLIAEVQMGLLALSFTLALGVFGLIPYLSVRDNIKYGADQLSYWISLVYLPLLEISSIGSLLGQAQQNTPLMWRVLLPGFLALTVMTRHVFFIHEQDNRRPFNHVNDNELNQLTEGSTAIIFDKEALDPGAPWLDKLRSY